MGIFGALQSAVSGLKAQSHAMENISGNIANSQTIGYKRIDTSFLDMIPDAPVKSQVAGAVSSFSRSMNTLRGDIQNADTETYMALNGNGFFVVENGDGSGGTFYTRRGDFDIDRNGFLVNGAGYRLTGLTMDNGVVSGSVPQSIKIDNSFLPAKRTTTIDYQLNLPQMPKTASYVSTTPGSELLKPWSYNTVVGTPSSPARTGSVSLPATVPAFGVGGPAVGTALARTLAGDGDTLKVTINGVDTDIEFVHTGPAGAGQIEVEATDTVDDLITDLQTALGATANISIKNGSIYVRLPDASTDTLAFASTRADGSTNPVLGLSVTTPSVATGSTTASNVPADMLVTHGDSMVVKIGSTTRTYRFNTTGSLTVGASETRINATGTVSEMLAAIEADLKVNGGPGGSGALVSVDATGNINVKFTGNYRYDVTINGPGATALGIDGPQMDAEPGALNIVSSADAELFQKESISGGGITVYSNTGEPVNVQIRWGKLTSEAGVDTWGMFYASDSNPGSSAAYTKLAEYSFKDGVLTSVTPGNGVTANGTEKLTIENLTVNGRNFGEIAIAHGLKGMTQFADNSGMVTTTTMKQNGFGAGEFISVGISDEGQVVASYSNGETKAVAQIVTASFSNANALKRGDGGTYTATTESGEPIIDQTGEGIVGGSTEASNTDISEEFTKLIVTQQAYSANTKIVTAADEMLQEALNMIR